MIKVMLSHEQFMVNYLIEMRQNLESIQSNLQTVRWSQFKMLQPQTMVPFTIYKSGQMKKGNFRPPSEPIVRILLVAPHLYQVSLFNIKGYLKNFLLDRCKKVGAQYRYFEHSYFVDSNKLLQLKREFQDLLRLPNPDPEMKFKIEDFPMANIKLITREPKLPGSKPTSKNRVIFLDRFSQNRYFYAKKRLQHVFSNSQKEKASKQPKVILILTSEINKKLWTSAVLKNHTKTTEVKQQMLVNKESHQLIELTFSELTTKKPPNTKTFNSSPPNEQDKIYLITYDNLKFVEGSWFLAEVRKASIFFTDDAEFLIPIESQLATLECKKRNFDNFRLLLQNYSIENELMVFLSKMPEPCELLKLLILVKPKSFTGIKVPMSFEEYFNEKKLNPGEKKMLEDFGSWFRKRYRGENKCFKEIYYLLNSVVLRTLDQGVFQKSPSMIPSLELPTLISEHLQIHFLDSSSELIEKFKTMDKKYKKQWAAINFREILQAFHDKEKSHMSKFQITTNLDNHLINKNSKNYFLEARELMLNSKIDLLLRRLFFVVNVQRQRIAVVVEDEKLEKRLKKYFKETQVEYVDYSLARDIERELPYLFKPASNFEVFTPFDAKPLIPVCIINSARVYKEYIALIKEKRKMTENQYEDDTYAIHSSTLSQDKICVPKITTAGSVHFIDSFWYEFSFQKEIVLNETFNCEMSFVEETKQQNQSLFKQVFKKPDLPSNYYLFQGSHEKAMLEKYLQRKEELQSFKQEPVHLKGTLLVEFTNRMIQAQRLKFQNMNCQVIEYLDIDEEYDKIEEEAKQIKNAKGPEVLEQKVFLPKFTKPDQKSFKQMIEERLTLKNIDQILDESDDDFKSESETMAEPSKNKRQQNQQKVEKKFTNDNRQNEFVPSNRSQDALCPQQQNNDQYKEAQGSLFDCLLPICPEIKPQTIRLDSKYFQLPFQTQLPQLFQNHSPYEPYKDLFDQLLAPRLDFDYLSSQKNIDNKSEPEQPDTQSECNDENNFKRLKKVSTIQAKIEPKIDDSLLFQNFGHMIYHKKKWGAHDGPNQTQMLPPEIEKIQKTQLSSKQEDSIQIISSDDEAIDVEKIKTIKSQKKIGFSKKHQLKQLIQQKAGVSTVLKIQKGKRLSGKQFYEEAISKSKQLWEKKLRKQKETIILGPKKFELALVPKANWKDRLNEEEKKQLREKGIKFE